MDERRWIVTPVAGDRSARPRPVGRTKPTIWTCSLAPDDPAILTGSDGWHPAIVRAGAELGRIFGPLLVSQVLVAIRQQRAMLDALDRAWSTAIEGAAGDTDPGSTRRTVAEAVHWEAVGALGRAVENLHAIVRSIERLHEGDRRPEETFLAASPDLTSFLAQRKRRRPAYWLAFLGEIPTSDQLAGAGLTSDERDALLASYQVSAVTLADRHSELAGYYTPDLHRFYLRHKHGYALLSPWVGPALYIAPGPPDPSAALKEALERGFGIVHLGESAELRPCVRMRTILAGWGRAASCASPRMDQP